jgi:hypothetical protein
MMEEVGGDERGRQVVAEAGGDTRGQRWCCHLVGWWITVSGDDGDMMLS